MGVDGRTNGTVAKRNLSDVDINSHVGCELAVFFLVDGDVAYRT